MTSRAKHETSTAGKSLLQMLEDELDTVFLDRLVDGMDDYDAGFMDGYYGALVFAIATIRDPYRKDFDATCKRVVEDSEARATEVAE